MNAPRGKQRFLNCDMRIITITLISFVLVTILIARIWAGWSGLIWLGLFYLGGFGYFSDSFGIQLSRRIARVLLLAFVMMSIGQMILEYRDHRDHDRMRVAVDDTLTQVSTFMFRPPVSTQGRPLFMGHWHASEARDRFNSSRAYIMYSTILSQAGGWPGGPREHPPYRLTTAAANDFFMDVLELVLIEWLRTPFGMGWEIDSSRQRSDHMPRSTEDLHMAISQIIAHDIPHNAYIAHLAGPPPHISFLRTYHFPGFFYDKGGPQLPTVTTVSASPSQDDGSRTLTVKGPGYRMQVAISHEGRNVWPRAELFGIELRENGEPIPHAMTEDFSITITVRFDLRSGHEDGKTTRRLVLDAISRFRSDFDFDIYRQNISLRQDGWPNRN